MNPPSSLHIILNIILNLVCAKPNFLRLDSMNHAPSLPEDDRLDSMNHAPSLPEDDRLDSMNHAPSLPEDIVLDIVSRLPIKYIFRCKCLCTSFNSRISHPSFAKTYYSNLLSPANNSSTGILIHQFPENRLFHIDLESADKKPMPLKYPEITHCSSDIVCLQHVLIGSCKGLLCLSSFSTCVCRVEIINSLYLPPNPIYVYNPLTTEQLCLPSFGLSPPEDPNNPFNIEQSGYRVDCVSGFGFDTLKEDFKVVLVLFYMFFGEVLKKEVLIHTIGSNTWRRRVCDEEVRDELCNAAYKLTSSALVNNSLHWILMGEEYPIQPKIVSFNLGTEAFGYVPVPEPFLFSQTYLYNKARDEPLGEIGGCLSLSRALGVHKDIEVWVMKDYNVKESWSMLYHITFLDLEHLNKFVVVPFCAPINGEILLNCNSEFLVSFNIGNAQVKSIEFEGEAYEWAEDRSKAVTFVGSLISPKQLAEERKVKCRSQSD